MHWIMRVMVAGVICNFSANSPCAWPSSPLANFEQLILEIGLHSVSPWSEGTALFHAVFIKYFDRLAFDDGEN